MDLDLSSRMSNANSSWADCVCKKLGDFCGTATPCGIPGVVDAIKAGDWAKVASLIILGGACTLAPAAIVAMLIAAAFTCTFGASDEADELIKQELKKAFNF
jgi:hypothetical protein